jgi:ribonuclease HII
VVAGAAVFRPGADAAETASSVRDSKVLSASRREALARSVRATAWWGLGGASAREVDSIGVRPATLLAMGRAVRRLEFVLRSELGDFALDVIVDGVDALPGFSNSRSMVRADALVPEVSAASILAKVFRDAAMSRLAVRHPGYLWERNAGYGTAAHSAGLRLLGRTPHHRSSFSIPDLVASSEDAR